MGRKNRLRTALGFTVAFMMALVSLALTSAPAHAAAWHFQDHTWQVGPRYSYGIDALENNWGTPYGSVEMTSDVSNEDGIRHIEVCDNSDDAWGVRMRVYPFSGGYIDYVASWGQGCRQRNLGYGISHFRMMFRGELSDPVDAPLG